MIPGKRYTPELILTIAARRWWLILLPVVLVGITGAGIARWLPDQFRSDTLILVVPQRVPESYVRSTVTTRIEDRLQSISQQILSRTRLERIINDFNLYPRRRQNDIMEDIVEDMRKDIDLEIVKGDAFRVGFTAEDRQVAMKVTERLASFFIDESLRDREVLAEGTNQFLESQLEVARRQLIENESQLAVYRRKHDGELPSQMEGNLQVLQNLEMQLQSLLDSANRDRDRRFVLDRILEDTTAIDAVVPMPTADSTVPRTAAEKLRAAEAELQTLRLRLTPQHPDVLRLTRTIGQLQKQVELEVMSAPTAPPVRLSPLDSARLSRYENARTEREQLDRDLQVKTAEEKRVRALVASYQGRIAAVPARESELAELMRDYETLQQTYRALLAKKQESQISANLERRQIGEQFKILDPARLPEKPTSPNRPLIYLGSILVGLAVGLSLVAGLEHFDQMLRTEDDVRLALSLPVVATVPFIESPKGRLVRPATIAAMAGVVVLGAAAGVVWFLVG